MSDELWRLDASEVAEAVRSRAVRPREVVESVLERLEEVEPHVHAIAAVAPDALAAADDAEQAVLKGEPLGPLHGVPVTVKDLLATEGIATARGMAGMAGRVPVVDAPSVALVRRAGAVLVAKTTTSEIGHKAVTDGPFGPPTANPWDLTRTAGGSSGGAAAALATGVAPLALATDGGGSIRVPASFCGLVGIKPTTGLVPTHPPSRLGPLGHTGPMGRSTRDVALLLDVMAGDGDRLPRRTACEAGIEGRRIAFVATLNGLPVEPEVAASAEAAALVLEEVGAEVERVELPCEGFEAVWDVLYSAGVLADYRSLDDDARATTSPGLAAFIAEAEAMPPGAAERAEVARVLLVRRLQRELESFDLVAGPTVALPAFPLGIDDPAEIAGVPVGPRDWWRLTQLWNLTGSPAASVPATPTASGLPIGFQLVGRPGEDGLVLSAAAAFEDATCWRWSPVDPAPVEVEM